MVFFTRTDPERCETNHTGRVRKTVGLNVKAICKWTTIGNYDIALKDVKLTTQGVFEKLLDDDVKANYG